jgi:hypothetical protein
VTWWGQVASDLRAGINLDTYIAVALALLVAGLDVFGIVSGQVISAAALAVLALFAFSVAHTQREARGLRADVQALTKIVDQSLSNRPTAAAFFEPRLGDQENKLALAQRIDVAGITLSRTIRDYASVLTRRVEEGAHVRVLMVDPSGPGVDQAAARSWGDISGEFYVTRMRPTIDLLRLIANVPGCKGALELRLVSFVPTFGLILLDSASASGHILVELYPHKTGSGGPCFEMTPARDPQWSAFFIQQFEALWKAGRPATQADGFTGRGGDDPATPPRDGPAPATP